MNETVQEIIIAVNGAERRVGEGMTVAKLLDELSIGCDGTAVAVNDAIVVRSAHAVHQLRAGDRVEILHAVAGG